MNAAANKEVILRLYDEAVNQGRYDEVITEEIVRPDATMHNALHSDLRGPEVLRATWRSLHAAFSELKFEIDDIIADGDLVAVRGTTTGKHTGVFRGKPGTGRLIAQRAHMFYGFEGNRVREIWPLVDHAGLAQQLEDPDDAQLQWVMDLATGFWQARALISGVELGLFTLLAKEPANAETVRAALDLDIAGTGDFLDALVALGALRRDNDGRYRNSPASQRHLDERSDVYIGGFLKFMGYSLYPAWGRLTDLLRTGTRQEGQDSFGDWYNDLDQVRGFMEAMDSICSPVIAALDEAFDWASVRSVADLGGARGNLVARLVRRHPHLTGVCLDLPAVQPLFEEHMAALGTGDRVTFQGGDFRTAPLPEADVLIFGHILHDWDEETRALLVRRAFDAVREGGALLIYDELLDDDRCGPARSLLMSLNMKLVRTGGSEYTAEQGRSWLLNAGFTDVTVQSLTATERLLVARKP
jgi:predicted ester cyclase